MPNFESKINKAQEILLGHCVADVIDKHSFLEYMNKCEYDGSYIYMFRVQNKQKTKEFRVYAYTREPDTACYSVRFSSVRKVA